VKIVGSSPTTQLRAGRPHHNITSAPCSAASSSSLRAGRPHHNIALVPHRKTVTGAPPSCPLWGRASRLPFRDAEVGHRVAGCIDTSGNLTKISLIAVIALLISTIAAAAPPLASIKLGETSPPVEIVRCHFDEGRIVVRHADKLHVLRTGDELEDTGLRLLETTPESATLAIRQTSPTASLRIIKIVVQNSGALLVREFATDPAALTDGSAVPAPQTATRSSAADKPKSSPDGD